jgi:hypothetical protein
LKKKYIKNKKNRNQELVELIIFKISGKISEITPPIWTQSFKNKLKKLEISDFRNYVATIYQKMCQILWQGWG